MNKTRLAIILCFYITVLIILVFINPSSFIRKTPSLENAEQIEYIDITQQVSGLSNGLKSGEVWVWYLRGHKEDDYTIVFKSFKPYESLKLYNIDGVLVVIYNEKKNGVRSDIVISPEYFPFTPIPMDMDNKVKVYRNNRLVSKVITSYAIE